MIYTKDDLLRFLEPFDGDIKIFVETDGGLAETPLPRYILHGQINRGITDDILDENFPEGVTLESGEGFVLL